MDRGRSRGRGVWPLRKLPTHDYACIHKRGELGGCAGGIAGVAQPPQCAQEDTRVVEGEPLGRVAVWPGSGTGSPRSPLGGRARHFFSPLGGPPPLSRQFVARCGAQPRRVLHILHTLRISADQQSRRLWECPVL